MDTMNISNLGTSVGKLLEQQPKDKSLLSNNQNLRKMQQQNNASENSKVRVIVIFEVKEEKRQEFLGFLDAIIKSSRKEEGNIFYDLYCSTEKPNEFLLNELWSNKDTFGKHYNSPEAYKARDAVSSLLVKPLQIRTYTEVNKI